VADAPRGSDDQDGGAVGAEGKLVMTNDARIESAL
jgi:hypothetical protein